MKALNGMEKMYLNEGEKVLGMGTMVLELGSSNSCWCWCWCLVVCGVGTSSPPSEVLSTTLISGAVFG